MVKKSYMIKEGVSNFLDGPRSLEYGSPRAASFVIGALSTNLLPKQSVNSLLKVKESNYRRGGQFTRKGNICRRSAVHTIKMHYWDGGPAAKKVRPQGERKEKDGQKKCQTNWSL